MPWLADFRDPWYSEARLEQGSSLESWWIRKQESIVMQGADIVIANAPGACKVLRQTYPQFRSKFVTLPNGYDHEKFQGIAAEIPLKLPGDPIRVVHTGAIYVGRDPLPFLDALKRISNGPEKIALNFCFFGPAPENGMDLGHEVEIRGLNESVTIEGQVSYANALQEMARADLLLLMDSPGRTVGVPAKLYEYIGAGRPILALGEEEGDLSLVLQQSGVTYRIARPDDVAAIARSLVELSREARLPRTANGCDSDRFSREAIAGRLAVLLDRYTGQGRGVEVGTDAEPQTIGI